MNKLGKLLVLLHVTISVLAMSFAGAVFLQFIDWGWKEPRQYLDERIASEYDKRAAALNEAHRAYDALGRPVSQAQDRLLDAERRFPTNHLFYVAKLEELRNSGDKIEVKEVKMANGAAVLNPTVIGPPVLEAAVPVTKSYAKYLTDYYGVQKQIEAVSSEIKKVIATEEALSARLSGTKEKPGLYDQVEIESERQKQIKSDKDYVQPQWVSALRQLSVYKDRQTRLEATLGKLKGK